ncbi:Asp-tRNA(Asn)/Glu-tRNA(Gln) amidotransferase subunit GatC [Candidatus Nanogingivalis gingivitcus]|jgi:aspartyl/glutamyl-tRNA(asn/gln) amidotransferase, C subunit|uniref:Aspartyl/glutamyl-tRNA(Asn/Gln) amidotransferase subunit C n=1 Tax=Candidatus Nanogingivalis gingivitcus TaxID=2171992 RepID=A0ABY0FKJ7_9BACT|nr:Asp-tRNA(Asn)/Glu-tRNA(Gln) amidotransferase subunit GatC [Candidatus Nanogingivalis gingivitcus]RYC72844.1 Aspartyl/glutamyl-tRNA(Asn/Gln) amidotransferase subunit C [Candidatus Nanogingivalis gingivitcus]
MSEISKQDIEHLAKLSNLKLEDAEVENLQEDLKNIIGYIEQLSELNTENIEPTYQVSDNQNIWRKDEINNYNVNRDKLLDLAGDNIVDNQIKVPKVL